MEEYKNQNKVTVAQLIEILQEYNQGAVVINGKEENIRIYAGREARPDGDEVIMIFLSYIFGRCI